MPSFQVRSLKSLGHDVITICGCPEDHPLAATPTTSAAATTEGIIAIPLPTWGRLDAGCAWQDYAEGCTLPSLINAVQTFAPDVVIGIDWHSATAYSRLAASLSPAGSPPPYVYSNYRVYLRSCLPSSSSSLKDAQDTQEKRELISRLEGHALSLSKLCSFVLSRSDKEFITHHYHNATTGDTLHVLLPALRSDMEEIPLLEKKERKRKYLTCCTRASPEKEPHRYVDIICELQRRGTFERLHIVPLVAGAGWALSTPKGNNTNDDGHHDYAWELRQRLQKDVPSCVVVESFLGPSELAEIYSQTALNIHPCAYDAYGMTVIEAASQGAPTLLNCGGHVGASDLLHPSMGLAFETNIEAPVSQVADVVEQLLENEEELRKVGEAAVTVARTWSERANAETLINVLRSALNHRLDDSLSIQEKHVVLEQRGAGRIDVVDARTLQYSHFIEHYMSTSRPVVLQNATEGWRAAEDWVIKETGDVDIDFLEKHFGEAHVSVTEIELEKGGDILTGNPLPLDTSLPNVPKRICAEPVCRQMTLKDYCAWWRSLHSSRSNGFIDKSSPTTGNCSDGNTSSTPCLLYLKDWHFTKDFPEYDAYECPPFFLDDWLNEWYDAHTCKDTSTCTEESAKTSSDYRFVYLGPRGTQTSLHADVLRSHSWSANITGRKLWRLLPPQHAHLLLDKVGRTTAPDFFNSVALSAHENENENDNENENENQSTYPGLAEAQRHVFEVIQHPGEAIFVPSGWFHTVDNLDDCMSINHNWISTHSISNAWAHIQHERAQAADLIEDCREGCSPREFEYLVQINTRANCSMDYAGIGAMIRCVVESAAKAVTSSPPPLLLAEERSVARVCVWYDAKARLVAAQHVLLEIVAEERVLLELEKERNCAKDARGRENGVAEEGDSSSSSIAVAAAGEWTSAKNELEANEKCLELISCALETP